MLSASLGRIYAPVEIVSAWQQIEGGQRSLRRTAGAWHWDCQLKSVRLVLGDQLSPSLSSLADMAADDVVLLAEVMGECTYVRHHAKKIVLVLSAMRHFAEALRAKGVRVDYIELDDPANTQSLCGEVRRAIARHRARQVVVTEPGEWRLMQDMKEWQAALDCDVDIRDDDRFLCTQRDFRAWAAGKKSLRMEFFYREMRKRYEVLMEKDGPAGGQWNFDPENRKKLPVHVAVPPKPSFPPDQITGKVMALVAEKFADHFGFVSGFDLPVTSADAAIVLDDFITNRLPGFGDWQDAMKTDAPFLFHSLVSTSLNLGLLSPLEIIKRAEKAFGARKAPINAVEGFVRQILGWREYIRGIYWLNMPGYAELNALAATRRLPQFYWSGETHMHCLAQAIGQTRDHAYAHHIQRLMVTGNFALLAGIAPDEVDEWYLIVYADAYEWVEMPNTRGMALFADGGVVGSKPYAASGAYINRMSDYCRHCRYDVTDATGPNACPFNFLYWDFIDRNVEKFASNTRMAMPLRNLERMPSSKLNAIRAKSREFLSALDTNERV
jgi:deoxyribodipyrimidine photolyase-related protein